MSAKGEREAQTKKWEEETGHSRVRCRGKDCSGCRDGMDCRFESLAMCKICGGMEGSLLPKCPGRRLTPEEDKQNYKDYCNGTGPFSASSS